MNVFVDFTQNNDHYYSLHLLFEKRLGLNLFRPTGPEWQTKGFQYVDSAMPSDAELIEGIYHIPMRMEPERGYYTKKAITLAKFLKMDFDFTVTIYAAHEEPFYNLTKTYKPHAVFIRQIANMHEIPAGFCKNVLLGTSEPMPPDINYISYFPEHYEGYCYTQPPNHNTVNNFVHDLPFYPYDLAEWNKCESALPDFTFKMHGHHGRDDEIPHSLMPQTMKNSAFIWNVKAHGGGGFVLRQALACGRPCIVRKRYAVVNNSSEKNLLEDSVNCIDLDFGTERAIDMIKTWSQPERHIEVCKAIAEKFKKDVNFAEQAEQIKEWLNNLSAR
jgi:hypothetical protein